MRAFSLLLPTLACALSLASGPAAWAAEAVMPPATAKAAAQSSDSSVQMCANITKVCGSCGDSQPSGIFNVTQSADGGWCGYVNTPKKSLINNLNFDYIHTAWDYQVTDGGGSGCTTCGGGSTASSQLDGGLTALEMKRTHRFRTMTEPSSFGPGVFGTYDVSLRIARNDAGAWQVIVTDPASDAPYVLSDAGGGVFRGAGWNKIQGLSFYTGASGGGTLTTNPGAAVSAILTTFSGYRYAFELFDPYGTLASPWTYGEIGTPASHGSAGLASGAISLSASGGDIWGAADSFGYVYQAVQGDTTVTARVDSFATYRGLAADGTDPNAKIGIMLRETLDANARTVNLGLKPGAVQFISRVTAGGSMVQDAIQSSVAAPLYLRLQRTGNTIVGSTSSNGSTWTVVTTKTVAMAAPIYVGLSVTGHNTTGALTTASFSNVSVTGTAITPASSWPALVGSAVPYTSPVLAGRLTSIADRNGYAVAIAYKAWTAAQLQAQPDLRWEMDTVTDAHGRTLSFTYGNTTVGGHWAVQTMTLPNGWGLTYTYANGLLSGVTYPDSSTSSFTYTPDAPTSSTIVHYDDAGATDAHRRKSAYLTNIFTSEANNRGSYPEVYNQASNLIKLLLSNNDSEVDYLCLPQGNLTFRIYEGGGRMKEVAKLSAAMRVRYFTSWTYDTTNHFVGTAETAAVQMDYPSENLYRQGCPNKVTDVTGVVRTYATDTDGFPNVITYSDATTEKYTYNSFKQVTRYEDRLKRVTLTTYDTKGNETQREVGILYNGTADVHQAEYAVTKKQYYPAGDPNQYLLKADIDANGNTTTYAYTAASVNGDNHFVKTITTPNDAGTGTIVAATLGYDTAGRTISSADALGRTATSSYDGRNRRVRTTYSDGSTEITVYGSGADKNLVVQRKDRQGALTEYAYDDAGRLVTTTVGAKTMSADGATITVIPTAQVQAQSLVVTTTSTYLAGTTLESSRTVNGDLKSFAYDYRLRKVGETVYPTSTSPGLTTTWTYDANNQLRQVTDPYGRKAYSVYRTIDGRLIRRVQGLVPADGLTDYTGAAGLARSTATTNPPYLITDFGLDAEGQQISVTDPRAIVSTMTYDSRGRLTQRVDASSVSSVAGTTQTLYDAQSNVIEVRTPRYFTTGDANGYQKDRVTSTYTKRNLLLSRTAAPGVTGVAGTTAYTYYDDGRNATVTDANGHVRTTTWKPCCARVDAEVDPQATDAAGTFYGTVFTDYSDSGDLTHTTVVRGTTGSPVPGCCNQNPPDAQTLTESTTAYDVRHRRAASTQFYAACGGVDSNSPPIAGQNGVPVTAGLTTTWRYDDDLSDALGLSNPADADSVAPYLSGLGFGAHAVGSALLAVNPAGERQWTVYDGLGRLVRTIDGNGHATTTTYDVIENGLLKTTVTDALSHATAQLADSGQRVRIQRDALLNDAVFGYDADGSQVSVRDPNGVGQDCVFDARNRRTDCTDTRASTPAHTGVTYDANGNALTTTDPLTHVTTMTYDARDRKLTTLDRVAGTTAFSYDLVGNLLTIVDADPLAGKTSYVYDGRDLLTSETYPPGQATPNSPSSPPLDRRTYVYDAAGRLVSRVDQVNVTTTYVYDFISRLTNRNYSDGLGNDLFSYDAASRLTVAAANRYLTTVTRSYTNATEHAGRLVSETQTIGSVSRTVGYQYDAADRKTTVTYPDASASVRAYDARNQLSSVKLGTATIASAFTYDAGLRRTQVTFGNGLVEQRTYAPGDNLVATIAAPAVVNFSYTYDAAKRVTQEGSIGAAEDQHFGYDNENRVTSWDRHVTADAETWTLSKVGDWTSLVRTGTTPFNQTRQHSAVHEIKSIAPSGQSAWSLGYDAKGNLLSDPSVTPAHAYQWDDENRLLSASVGSVGASYVYDALGRRLAKSVGSVTTVYVHDGAQALAEYENGALARRYVYGTYVDEPLALLNATGTYYYANNRVYSVAALTDAAKNVVERYRYDTYGRETVLAADGTTTRSVSSYGNQVGFTGRYLDQETGLWYFRSRYESPTLGRFITRDPQSFWAQFYRSDHGNEAVVYPAARDGYVDGWSLYAAYFDPNYTDSYGESCKKSISRTLWGVQFDVPNTEDTDFTSDCDLKCHWCRWYLPVTGQQFLDAGKAQKVPVHITIRGNGVVGVDLTNVIKVFDEHTLDCGLSKRGFMIILCISLSVVAMLMRWAEHVEVKRRAGMLVLCLGVLFLDCGCSSRALADRVITKVEVSDVPRPDGTAELKVTLVTTSAGPRSGSTSTISTPALIYKSTEGLIFDMGSDVGGIHVTKKDGVCAVVITP